LIATKEVTTSKAAADDAAIVYKALLKKESLKRVKGVIGSMKKYHDTVTLPWNNDGGRLLPSTKYNDYTAFFRKSQQELEDAVVEFAQTYEAHKLDAQDMLGKMYDNSDYPETAEIIKKFAIDAHFDKVPEAADFRVDIPDFEQKRICKQIEDRIEKQHAESMRKVWKRIYDNIYLVYDRLKDENAIFRDSLINNVQDLVDILPELNILENQDLDVMAHELKTTICSHTPEVLRQDKATRKQVADESKKLLDKIDGLFGGVTIPDPQTTDHTDNQTNQAA